MPSSPEWNPLHPGQFQSGESLTDADRRKQRTADRVYQCLTLAAMLWALASLWVF